MTGRSPIAPQVAWTVEKDGILLLNEAAGVVRRLRYPEAALWDWLSRGEPYQAALRKMALVAKLEPEAARQVARRAVDDWLAAGFLEVERG